MANCQGSGIRNRASGGRRQEADVRDQESGIKYEIVKITASTKGRAREILEINSMPITSPKDLIAYKKAYVLAMDIFVTSKTFPREEQYSLTDQIRRSSRSVCANLREAWAKRRYIGHFISKMSDADGENAETETWLDFAHDCGYISSAKHKELVEVCREVGAMIGGILNNPAKFTVKSNTALR